MINDKRLLILLIGPGVILAGCGPRRYRLRHWYPTVGGDSDDGGGSGGSSGNSSATEH